MARLVPDVTSGERGRTIVAENQPNQQEPADEPEAPEAPEHEFLIPGPTPTSNDGCLAWGFSWVLMSIVLLIIVAVMTVGCYGISRLTGIL